MGGELRMSVVHGKGLMHQRRRKAKGKGKAKNTTTKAKYNRLMHQKVNKVKLEKQLHKERIKALTRKVNEEKNKE